MVKPGDKMSKKKLILKIGSSTLCAGTNRISYAKIEDIARQIISLQKDYNIVLVSSGAIAAARQFVDISNGSIQVDSKQAMAAIGQPKLISIYDEVFSSFGLKVAQCLLVYRDFESEVAKNNVKNTINKLLEFGYTPIINENDTVAVDEIVLGDNDKLSAFVATITEADLLVLASDINGLYTQNPFLHKDAQLVNEVTDLEKVLSFIDENKSELGTGGMATKVQAARICKLQNIEMWILNGGTNNFLLDALESKVAFTKFI
jgi:glutamate 5-kinase